jgi:esterase/lipase superfamily enzyme
VRSAILLIAITYPAAAQQFFAVAVRPPTTVTSIRVYYVTDRKFGSQTDVKQMYTAERSQNGVLSYGTCVVTIPRSHVLGSLEEPGLFEFSEDSTKHVILQKVAVTGDQDFYDMARARLRTADRKDAFVFIHGYNTTFHDAARRTAQIAYDLKFDGVPMFYSWPSQGKVSQYLVDETNAEWTIPHLVAFLREIRAKTGARKIHLIAHSMGARALTRALKELDSDKPASTRFNQIVLAAPDIDAETFAPMAKAINHAGDRITMYASSRDRAIKISKSVHGYPRAGESGGDLVVVPGVDTIDATSLSTDFFSHSYFSGRTVLADLFVLIRFDTSPSGRFALYPEANTGFALYWKLHP